MIVSTVSYRDLSQRLFLKMYEIEKTFQLMESSPLLSWGPECNPKPTYKCKAWWHMLIIQLRRKRHRYVSGTWWPVGVANSASQGFQRKTRLSKMNWCLTSNNTPGWLLVTTHVNIHMTYTCIHTCTYAHMVSEWLNKWDKLPYLNYQDIIII